MLRAEPRLCDPFAGSRRKSSAKLVVDVEQLFSTSRLNAKVKAHAV